MARVTYQPAFLLHSRAYRESSVLLEMLTSDYGRVGLIYKGAKRSHNRAAQLQPFCRLSVGWSGKGELHTLTGLEVVATSQLSTPRLKICGLYLNELIIYLVPRGVPSEDLYRCYEATVTALDSGTDIESPLRRFEFHLLKLSGYGPQVAFEAATERPIEPNSYYQYDNERGPVLSPAEGVREPVFSGRTLLTLEHGPSSDAILARESKRLLRSIIDYQLRGKSLISREIMRYLEHLGPGPA